MPPPHCPLTPLTQQPTTTTAKQLTHARAHTHCCRYCFSYLLGRLARGTFAATWGQLGALITLSAAAVAYLIATAVAAVFVGPVLPYPLLGAVLLVLAGGIVGGVHGYTLAHVWVDLQSRDFRAGSAYNTVFKLSVVATCVRRVSELVGAVVVAAVAGAGYLA